MQRLHFGHKILIIHSPRGGVVQCTFAVKRGNFVQNRWKTTKLPSAKFSS